MKSTEKKRSTRQSGKAASLSILGESFGNYYLRGEKLSSGKEYRKESD